MPAFLAHYWALQMATDKIKTSIPGFWNFLTQTEPTYRPYSNTKNGRYSQYSQHAFLGSVAPDVCYYGNNDATKSVSDFCHHKKTGVLVANMLDEAKNVKEPKDKKAILAFILGYISHIATDIIAHPYINNFAGDYYKQKIDPVWTFKNRIFGINIPVQMHMFSEVHQDGYIAKTRYGSGNLLSNGPGDKTATSWSDFWNDLISGGLGASGHNPVGSTKEVIKLFHKSIQNTFNSGIALTDVEDALGKAFDALDLGYDMAIGPIIDKYYDAYVNHQSYQNWMNYERFLGISADVTANVFWTGADKYYNKSGKREEFLEVIGSWNLDTGYMIRVYNAGDTVHVRYEHSWAKYF